MQLTYTDTQETNTIELFGTALDADIRLESRSLALPQTYISLSSTNTIHINNRSDIMARFSWKLFGTDAEEASERARKKAELRLATAAEDQAFLLVHTHVFFC